MMTPDQHRAESLENPLEENPGVEVVEVMGGGLLADCRGKNIEFSTHLGVFLGMKKRHRHWLMASQ